MFSAGKNDYGAGLFSRDASPRFDNCTWQANKAVNQGGGMVLISTRLLAEPATPADGKLFLLVTNTSDGSSTADIETGFVAIGTEKPNITKSDHVSVSSVSSTKELRCDFIPRGLTHLNPEGKPCPLGCALWSDMAGDGCTRSQSAVNSKFASGVPPTSRCCAQPANDPAERPWCYCRGSGDASVLRCDYPKNRPVPNAPGLVWVDVESSQSADDLPALAFKSGIDANQEDT